MNTHQLLIAEVVFFVCFKLKCLINCQVFVFFVFVFLSYFYFSFTNEIHLACIFESILPHKVYENMFVEDDDGGSEQTGPL